MGTLFVSILPGFLVGLLFSSYFVALNPVQQIKRWTHSRGAGAVVFMAFAGVLSPFCSYLAVPIAASLIAGGITPAPVIAFLCATPLMNPTLFAMTWSMFGWPMAAARALSAFGFGILGGYIASRFEKRLNNLIANRLPKVSSVLVDQNPDPSLKKRWLHSARHLGWFALKYVTLGIAIAAVVKEFVPMEWVEAAVGRQYGYSVLLGALLGIPLYACGGGTIPMIQVLMDMGMAPGAALAFFIAGPATKLPTLTAMNITMGLTITTAYLILSLIWSILAGMVFQGFYL